MIPKVIITIADKDIKNDPPPKFLHILIGSGTVAHKEFGKVQIGYSCSSIHTICISQ